MTDRGNQFGARGSVVACFLAIGLVLLGTIAAAADEVQVETLLNDLRGPSGIAIRTIPGAEAYEIYVAEVGAGRIVRLNSGMPNASEEAITGFIASTDDDDLRQLPGPHGLLFLDPNRLVVTGSEGEARPFVRLYELGDPKKPQSAEQHEQQAAPATGEEQAEDGVAGFHSVARTLANDKVPDSLVITATGKESNAKLWRLPVRSGTLGDLKPLGNDQPNASSLAIAVEPRGHIVIVRPERNDSTASRMEFVNPIDGRTVVELTIKLTDIVGVAYSPRTGNLYAISDPPRDSGRNGVYRIDSEEATDSGPSATATLVGKVRRPTALAFGPDGALYVTSLGSNGRNGKGGSLLKISAGL